MNVWTAEYLVVLTGLFVLGTVIGSMLNVWIHRLPLEERFWPALTSLVYPPSSCPRCGRPIAVYDNIPIVGWIVLRGRCRSCRGRISIRYPLVELLTGVLFALVYWCEIPDWWNPARDSTLYHALGPGGVPALLSPLTMLHFRYALHMLLIVHLVAATFIDVDHRIIPDVITLPAMAAGFAGNALLGQVYLVPVWYKSPDMAQHVGILGSLFDAPDAGWTVPGWAAWAALKGVPGWVVAHPHLHGACVSAAGIVVGGGVVWGVRLVGQWALGREAMGFGDVVLLAMIGSFIGWQAALAVFFIAPICALAVVLVARIARRDREIPYGPYLSLATLVLLVSFRSIWPRVETHILAFGPLLVPAALVMFVSLAGLLFSTRVFLELLGVAPPPPPADETDDQWNAGDQLAYLAGECSDLWQGQWPKSRWPGLSAGRGVAHSEQWRNVADGRRAGGVSPLKPPTSREGS